jgi:hypothetical protein
VIKQLVPEVPEIPKSTKLATPLDEVFVALAVEQFGVEVLAVTKVVESVVTTFPAES